MTGSRENKDYDWAFDLRAFNCDSSDDGDGDGGSDNGGQPPLRLSTKNLHEVRLEDFDLGLREESVSYKPNPFSIAKINAAYRSARDERSEAINSLPQNNFPRKACPLVQTKIDDILKKQNSSSLKTAVATKGSRPCVSYANSEANTKQMRPKNGPSMNCAFIQPQNVKNSNANPEFKESSTARSGCSLFLEPTLLSANAHTLTLSSTESPSLLNDEPACILPSSSDNQYIKPDSMSPFRNFSLFSSPMRSAVSKLEATSIFPKHESPQPTALSTSRSNPGFVERCPLSNSEQIDQKFSANHRVKREFHSSEISALGRTEEDVHLSHASVPFVPSPRNRDACSKRLAMNTGPFRAPTPLSTVHIPKRQTVAQVTRPVVPLKRNVRDAYSFSVEDPDVNWSTLPTRKKQLSKNHRTSTSKVTKSFRLPGLLPPQKIVKTETDDISGKRVVTYLPPPLMRHADELIHPSASRRSYPISRVQEKMSPARRSSPLVATSYPSPSHARISRPSQVYPVSQTSPDSVSQRVLAPTIREQVIEVYRPPSPPTSDPPAKGADVKIQVDLRVISDNFSRAERTSHQKVFAFHFLSIRFGVLCSLG